MKVMIIIPAHNVEDKIEKVLIELEPYKNDVIIIDDGSIDNTYDIIKSANFLVVQNNKNRGVSYSICRGLKYALHHNYSHVILMDADGQHPVKYIPEFFEKLKDYNFVFANRFHNNTNAPDCKWSINILGAAFINETYNTSFTDISCGFKAFKLKKEYIPVLEKCDSFEIVYKILFLALSSKSIIGTVNIEAIYYYNTFLFTRESELKSYINIIKNLINDDYSLSKINTLSDSLINHSDFYVRVDDLDFWGFFLTDRDAYIIQSDPSIIKDYAFKLNGVIK